jgi:hypothetical protein
MSSQYFLTQGKSNDVDVWGQAEDMRAHLKNWVEGEIEVTKWQEGS